MTEGERPPQLIRSTPRLTRDEIVNQSFAQAFRGLSEASVRAFLRRVADDYDALRARQDELFAEIQRLERRLADAPAAPADTDLLTALGEETARVLRSAQESAEDIRRGAEERAAELLRDVHEECRLLREQTEQAATERTRHADESASEVLREAERLAAELQEGTEARVAQFEAQAEAEAQAEVESARRRSRELVAEAEAARDRLLSELARRREVLESHLEMLRGGRERLLDAYKTVRRTLDEATDSLRSVDARPSGEVKAPRVTSAALPAHHSVTDDERAKGPEERRPQEVRPEETPESQGGPGAEPAQEPAPEPAREAAPSPPRVGSFTLGELEVPVPRDEDAGARPQHGGPAAPLEKYRVEQPSGVRLLGTSRGPEPEAAEPLAVEDDAEAPVVPPIDPLAGAEPSHDEASRHETVDEIFARLRAQREADTSASVTDDSIAGDSPAGEAPTAAALKGESSDTQDAADRSEPPVPAAERGLRRRRDDALDPIVEELVRVVKRVVRDEQNVVLEAARRHKGVPSADAVLPSVADQDEAFADATADVLNEACALGESVARELGISGGINGDGARRRARARELAAALARELMDPLRGKLGDALRDAVASGDESQVGERVRARYREWKGQRIDAACRDALAGAFARGLYDAVPEGIPLRWVTTAATPCPDCADNALEHTPRGRKFPTGHAVPPAHPGCHCLVLPAEISADLEAV